MKLRSIHLTIQGTDWGVRALRDQQIPSEGPRNMGLNLDQCTLKAKRMGNYLREEEAEVPAGETG